MDCSFLVEFLAKPVVHDAKIRIICQREKDCASIYQSRGRSVLLVPIPPDEAWLSSRLLAVRRPNDKKYVFFASVFTQFSYLCNGITLWPYGSARSHSTCCKRVDSLRMGLLFKLNHIHETTL